MAIALCALLCFGITTIWVEGRWAVSILEAAVFLLSGAALLRGGAQASRAGERWALWIPAAVAVWGSVQLALGWTVALADTEWAMLYWLAAACFLWLGTLVEDRERFLNGLLWFSAAMSALALAQLNSSHGKILWVIPTGQEERIFGTFLNYDNYAAFIELVFPLAVWRTLENHRHWWLYAGMASLLYGSVIASTSRAGAVLVTLELAAVLLLGARRGAAGAQSFSRLLLVLGGVAAFTAVAGPGVVWERFWAPDPYRMRREFLESALAMAWARPLTGFGLGTWTSAYPAYAIADFGVIANHAHSEWGQWAAEGGVGVVALMAALSGLALRRGIMTVWGVGLTAVILHALVDYPLVRLGLGSWWFAILGVALTRPQFARSGPASESRHRSSRGLPAEAAPAATPNVPE